MARTCPECKGTGEVTEWLRDSDGNRYPERVQCKRCHGTGEVSS